MMSPSRDLSNSDTDPPEVRYLYSVAPPSASDLSKATLDPLLLEMKLAHEELDAAKEQEHDDSGRITISYEEALKREMEYQKRLEVIMSQHQVGSMPLPTTSQLPPNKSSVGIKRKATCGEMEPASGQVCHPTALPEELQEQQSLVQHSPYHKPLPLGPSSRQPLAPLAPLMQHSEGQPVKQQLQDRPPLPHQSLYKQPSTFKELPPVPAFRGSSSDPLINYQQFRQPLQVQQLQTSLPVFTGSFNPPEKHQQLQQPMQIQQPQTQTQHLEHQNPIANNRKTYSRQPPLHLRRKPQNYQDNPVWCQICNVKCVTHHNLKIHRQGRKHRNMQNELRSKKSTSSIVSLQRSDFHLISGECWWMAKKNILPSMGLFAKCQLSVDDWATFESAEVNGIQFGLAYRFCGLALQSLLIYISTHHSNP